VASDDCCSPRTRLSGEARVARFLVLDFEERLVERRIILLWSGRWCRCGRRNFRRNRSTCRDFANTGTTAATTTAAAAAAAATAAATADATAATATATTAATAATNRACTVLHKTIQR
jgi:hypothetical protein